ncbi:hypothetical protein CO111_00640, partial [Candidatus Desantisbacteria bacterium CG_4_9_14_3_um_filter_50_7]
MYHKGKKENLQRDRTWHWFMRTGAIIRENDIKNRVEKRAGTVPERFKLDEKHYNTIFSCAEIIKRSHWEQSKCHIAGGKLFRLAG